MELRRFHHGTTDSTNERAFAALAAGTARHGDVHVAHTQTAGRGRRGRPWVSPEGQGVYLSVLLLPSAPIAPAALTMAGGLAVLDATRRLGLVGATLKWPNDVMQGGAKLAGILAETRGLDPLQPHYVLGVGLNVGQRAFPPELARERPVTSLALEGVRVSVQQAEEALLACLPERFLEAEGDPERTARDFLAACGLAGRRVRARASDAEHTGELVRISISSGLVLREEGGTHAELALEFVRELRAF